MFYHGECGKILNNIFYILMFYHSECGKILNNFFLNSYMFYHKGYNKHVVVEWVKHTGM